LVVGTLATALPGVRRASAKSRVGDARTFTLENGLRTHCIENGSGYIVATLVLRSALIQHDGLAHICEHTSCSGAAGSMSAAEVAAAFKDYVQDGNASTEAGALRWHATFLPEYLPQVMHLLAAVTLDQRFDLETVEAQSRVVKEELFLEKYDADRVAQSRFDRELFGSSHPYAKETLAEELALCKTPPTRLATMLRNFANAVRLPANMDLFLVGSVDHQVVEREVRRSFGGYAYASGAMLDIPQVGITRAYRPLTEASRQLQRPMSDLKLAWNTGVSVKNENARVLLALGSYLSTALFDELREKDGDTYTPEVSYEPDACSGVFRIGIASSKDPRRVEKRVFDVIARLKREIDDKEIKRQRDRMVVKRCREAKENQVLLDRLVERTLEGAAVDELAVERVTQDDLLGAARTYLPEHRHAYVRLALRGQ
jgi:predicted Zn-dependent peptidase